MGYVVRQCKRVLQILAPDLDLSAASMVGELVWNRVAADTHMQPLVEQFTDDQARKHFGEEELVETEHLRRVVRYFHAWRVHVLRKRIGPGLAVANILDVGDTDGLILKHLGKMGIGFNISDAAIRNIQSNGIEAKQGDGHGLPFADRSFDHVLCFETLEHVENPHQFLLELARVCKPNGRIFISIPWVPRTFVHPRDPTHPRGTMHMFEFCRDDFASVVTHTPLRIVWEDVCPVLGSPKTLRQWCFLQHHRGKHIIAGTFRQFQFFELALER